VRAEILLREGRATEARDLLAGAKPQAHVGKRMLHRLALMQAEAGLVTEAIATLQAILLRDPERVASRQLLERLQKAGVTLDRNTRGP